MQKRYGTVLQFCVQEEIKGMKESNQKEFQKSEVN